MKNLYIAFDGDNDINYYNLLKAWNNNDSIPFNFSDSHDLNTSYDWSSREATKIQLKKRMNISDALVLLYGDTTTRLDYVKYEISLAKKMGLPIIVVDLNSASRYYDLSNYLPEILQDYYNVKVASSFSLQPIKNELFY